MAIRKKKKKKNAPIRARGLRANLLNMSIYFEDFDLTSLELIGDSLGKLRP
jgi:hypothetical protein